jgi:NAD(P)-dependent dehydrogenase (short-subunit alcohol dehydrogenase family)
MTVTDVKDQLITTPFGATSTADEVVAGHDLHGLRAVVTGAASGLGVETVRARARAGAEVTLAVRDTDAGARVAAGLRDDVPDARLRVGALDLADLASVAAFATAWDGPLHLLVDNAGVMATPLRRTPEGREWQFAVNHLGHHALAGRLHDALVAGAAERDGARVVALSSAAHMYAPVDLDDVDARRGAYDPMIAYGRSKTATVLFAVEATRRWAGEGVVANAVNPGGIRTGLQRHFTPELAARMAGHAQDGTFVYKTPQQGAATTLVAAVDPAFAHTGGHYLDDGQESVTVDDDTEPTDAPHGVKRWALDPEVAARLWALSDELAGTGR